MFAFIKNQKIIAISSFVINENFDEMLEFSEEIQNPYFDGSQIIEAPKIETEQEKFERIFKKICSPEIILNSETDHEILEWVEFSDTAIGDVIATKVFFDEKTGKWNPHGQMAMMAKTIADPSYKATEEVQNKMKSINDIRLFFGLVAFRSIK